MVGTWLLQQLIEVVAPGRPPFLLVGRRDLFAGGRAAVLLVLPSLPTRGGLIWVPSLRLCRGLVPHKDSSNCLLAGGMVGSDVQELASGARLLSTQFVDQHLAGRSGEERADHVDIDDIGEGFPLF